MIGYPTDPELGTMPCDTHTVVTQDPNTYLSKKTCTADVHMRINKRILMSTLHTFNLGYSLNIFSV